VRAALLTTTLILSACRAGAEPSAGATAPPAKAAPADAAAKASSDDATPAAPPVATVMKPELLPALEDELTAIKKDPQQSVGFGEKAFVPYAPNVAHALISFGEPAVTARLVAEIRGATDRVLRLALLHVLGRRTDATVDAALISLLDDPALRATASYLLGAVNMKGQPKRARDPAATAAILAALRPWLEDATPFEDPFLKKSFATADFALGAFVRTAGVEHFKLSRDLADLIGYQLPAWNAATRADLLAQAKAVR
jgi:hypothetical protein